jgi:hydroxymethylpyrimidine pyrophosphatase-like HAD family hydrolase
MTDCEIEKYSELNKPFKIIIFDWDGTAVVDRKADAQKVTEVLKGLLTCGIYVVVITGTNFVNIDRQFSSKIVGECKQNLFVCTNRGSEVFAFGSLFEPVLIFRRVAAKKENELLNTVVESTKRQIEGASAVKVEIVYNRLNRRKLDLIPEWNDPPKSEIDKLLAQTQSRLEKGGFSGGIKKAFALMENIAKSSGFGAAKITSDVKHLEIGLTDKSDSIKWVLANIARENNISNKEILIGGDEFGPIAGFEGSDEKMVIRDEKGITYFSVGIEPNGVPKGVINLGGGPECFVKLMQKQLDYHM